MKKIALFLASAVLAAAACSGPLSPQDKLTVNDKKINNTEDERIEFFQDNTAKITSYLPNDKRKENRGRLDLYYNVEYNWDGSYMLLLWEKESGNLYKVYYSYLLTTTKIKFFTLLDPATRKMTSKEYKRPMPALEDTTTPTEQ